MSVVVGGVRAPASAEAVHRSRGFDFKDEAGTWAIRVFLIVFCVLILLPAYWVFTASIQPGNSAYATSFFPSKVSGDNYRHIIDAGFWIWLKNSLVISVGAGLISLTINVLGAYAFSRLRFWGHRYGLLGLFLLQVFPQTMALASIYLLIVKANLFDTRIGVMLIFIGGSAYNMWLMKNYMDNIPRELDEAAYVDGANVFQTFYMVILPLMRPILATIFIWSFAGAYNDFIFSNLILRSPDNFTIVVGLQHEISGQYATNWALFSAGAVMASIPILILFLSLQRLLVSGLGAGAVKG